MPRILNVIVLLTFTLYVQSAATAWAFYALFSDQIAAAHCVNPTNPCCHGRCYVSQTTTKQQEQKGSAGGIVIEKTLPFITTSALPPRHTAERITFNVESGDPPVAGFAMSIEHPPPARF